MARNVPNTDFMYPILGHDTSPSAMSARGLQSPKRSEASITMSPVKPVQEISEFNRVIPVSASMLNRLLNQQIAHRIRIASEEEDRTVSSSLNAPLSRAERAERKEMTENLRMTRHIAWFTQLCALRLNHFLAHEDMKVPGLPIHPSYHPFHVSIEEHFGYASSSSTKQELAQSSSASSVTSKSETSSNTNSDLMGENREGDVGTISAKGLFSGTTQGITTLGGSLVPDVPCIYPELTRGGLNGDVENKPGMEASYQTSSSDTLARQQSSSSHFHSQSKPTFTGVGPYALPLPITLRVDRDALMGSSFSVSSVKGLANPADVDPSFRPPSPGRMVATPLYDDIRICEEALTVTRRRLQRAEALIQSEREKEAEREREREKSGGQLSSPVVSNLPYHSRSLSVNVNAIHASGSTSLTSTPSNSFIGRTPSMPVPGSTRSLDQLVMANAAMHRAKKELEAVTKLLSDHFTLLFTTPSHPLGLGVCTYVAWIRRRAAFVKSGNIDMSLAAYSPFSAYQHHHQLQQQLLACGNNAAAMARVHRRHARSLATYILAQYQQFYASRFFSQAVDPSYVREASSASASFEQPSTMPTFQMRSNTKSRRTNQASVLSDDEEDAIAGHDQASSSLSTIPSLLKDVLRVSESSPPSSPRPNQVSRVAEAYTKAPPSPIPLQSTHSVSTLSGHPNISSLTASGLSRSVTQPVAGSSSAQSSPSLTSQLFFASTPPTNTAISVFSLVAAGTSSSSGAQLQSTSSPSPSPKLSSRDNYVSFASRNVSKPATSGASSSSENLQAPSNTTVQAQAPLSRNVPSSKPLPLPSPQSQQPTIQQAAFAPAPRDPAVPFSYSELLNSQVLSAPFMSGPGSPALSTASSNVAQVPPPLQLSLINSATGATSITSPMSSPESPQQLQHQQPQLFFGPSSSPYITPILAPDQPNTKPLVTPSELQDELESLLGFVDAHWEVVLSTYPYLSESPSCAEIGKRVLTDVVVSSLLDCVFVLYKLACCEDDAAVLRSCKTLATRSLTDLGVPELFALGNRFPGRHAKRVHKLWTEFTSPPPESIVGALRNAAEVTDLRRQSERSSLTSNEESFNTSSQDKKEVQEEGTESLSMSVSGHDTTKDSAAYAPSGPERSNHNHIPASEGGLKEFVVPPPPHSAIESLTDALAALPKIPIAPYYRAVMKLRLIPFLPSISERLDCLSSVFTSINDSVTKYYSRRNVTSAGKPIDREKLMMCADDVIGVLAFCIIQAQIPCLVTVHQMLTDLLDPSLLNGPKGYGLATLASAISYVLQLEAQERKTTELRDKDGTSQKGETTQKLNVDVSSSGQDPESHGATSARIAGSYESTASTTFSMAGGSTWAGNDSIAGSAEIGSLNFKWGSGLVSVQGQEGGIKPLGGDANHFSQSPLDWSKVGPSSQVPRGASGGQPGMEGGGGLRAALELSASKQKDSVRKRAPSDASDMSNQSELMDEVANLLPKHRGHGGSTLKLGNSGKSNPMLDPSVVRKQAVERVRTLFGLDGENGISGPGLESTLYSDEGLDMEFGEGEGEYDIESDNNEAKKTATSALDLEQTPQRKRSVSAHARTTSEVNLLYRPPDSSKADINNGTSETGNIPSLIGTISTQEMPYVDPFALQTYYASTPSNSFGLGCLYGISRPITTWPESVSRHFFLQLAESSITSLLHHAGLSPGGYGLSIGTDDAIKWTLHSDKNHIRTYTSKVPGCPTPVVKATAVFSVNPAILFSILRAPGSRALLDPYCLSSEPFAENEIKQWVQQARKGLLDCQDPNVGPSLPPLDTEREGDEGAISPYGNRRHSNASSTATSQSSPTVAGIKVLKPGGLVGDWNAGSQFGYVRACDIPLLDAISAEGVGLVHHKFAVRHWLNKSLRDATLLQTGVALQSGAYAVASRSVSHQTRKAQDQSTRVSFLTNGFVIQPWKPAAPAQTNATQGVGSQALASGGLGSASPYSNKMSATTLATPVKGVASPRATILGSLDSANPKHVRGLSTAESVLSTPVGAHSASGAPEPSDESSRLATPQRSRTSVSQVSNETPLINPDLMRIASPRTEALHQQIQIVRGQIEHNDLALRACGYGSNVPSRGETAATSTPISGLGTPNRGLGTPVAPEITSSGSHSAGSIGASSGGGGGSTGSVYSIVTYVVDVDLNDRGAPWLYEAFTVGQGQAILGGLRELLMKTKTDGWGGMEASARQYNLQLQRTQLLQKQQTLRNRLKRLENEYKKQVQAILDSESDAVAKAALAAVSTQVTGAVQDIKVTEEDNVSLPTKAFGSNNESVSAEEETGASS